MAFSDSKSTAGGAIDNRGNNSIYNSNFINNQAIGFNGGHGGAIYNYNYSYIHNTTFINNQAIDNGDKSLNVGGVGGAIYYYPSVRTNYDLCTLSLCTFNNNSAKSTLQCYNKANGGAIYHNGVSFLNITSCDFTNNHADYYGGAIIIYSTYGKRSPNVISCFFDNNTATKRSPNIDGSFDQSANYYNDNSGVTNIPTIAVSNTLLHLHLQPIYHL